jgi:hypothetical protein
MLFLFCHLDLPLLNLLSKLVRLWRNVRKKIASRTVQEADKKQTV